MAGLQAQVDALTADKAALETSLQSTTQTTADLQAQIDALAAEKAAIEATLHEKEQAVVEMPAQPAEDVVAQITAERDELAARVTGLQAEVDAMQIDKMTLEAALQERATELEDMHTQLAAVAAVAAEPAAEVEAPEGERTASTSELAEAVTAEMAEGEPAAAETERAAETSALAEAVTAEVAETEVLLSPTVTNLKAGAMRAAFMLGAKPTSIAQPQDLTNIEGIGSTYEDRLYQAGIGTYWEVANLSDEDLFEVLQVGNRRAMMDAEAIRMSAFNLAQSSNTLGHVWSSRRLDDFERIPGISQTYEQRLYEAGIYTYQALAEMTVEQLESLIESPAHFRPAFERWIEGAKGLLE
jgi:predicted flap endonuclease-1-like 5' DNA nuclease